MPSVSFKAKPGDKVWAWKRISPPGKSQECPVCKGHGYFRPNADGLFEPYKPPEANARDKYGRPKDPTLMRCQRCQGDGRNYIYPPTRIDPQEFTVKYVTIELDMGGTWSDHKPTRRITYRLDRAWTGTRDSGNGRTLQPKQFALTREALEAGVPKPVRDDAKEGTCP